MTAYEVRISDWSSDVCSSALLAPYRGKRDGRCRRGHKPGRWMGEGRLGALAVRVAARSGSAVSAQLSVRWPAAVPGSPAAALRPPASAGQRSEEHTSELQSLMRISYAVFCLKKKKINAENKSDS